MGIEGDLPGWMPNEGEPPPGSKGESLDDPVKRRSQGIDSLRNLAGSTDKDETRLIELYGQSQPIHIENTAKQREIISEGSSPRNTELKAPDRLAEVVERSPFGSQEVSASLLVEVAESAKALGSAGQAIAEAASRIAANRDGKVELSPSDAADLVQGLKSAIELAGRSATVRDQIERQLEAHEGLIKYLFVNQEMIQRSLSTRERAVDVGGVAVATTVPTAMAAVLFGKPIAEEVATTLLEVAFGGGLVLLVRASIELIRSNSSPSLDVRGTAHQSSASRPDRARTVQDALDQRSRMDPAAAVAEAVAAAAAANAALEVERRHQLEQWQQAHSSYREGRDGDSFAR